MLTEAKYHIDQNYVGAPLEFGGFKLYQTGRLHCGSDMDVRTHTHYGWFEITAVTDGKGEIYTNGVPQSVKKGDMYLSFPCDVHSIHSSKSEPLKYDFCSFSTVLSPYKEDLDGIMTRCILPEKRMFSDSRIKRCMEELTLAVQSSSKLSGELALCLIKEIIIYLIRGFTYADSESTRRSDSIQAQPNSSKELCYQVMNYIDTHIYTMKNLSELSGITGYNYSYLSALFKEQTSQTLRSYYRNRKMDAANLLMKEKGMTAVRASELLGYTSASAFGKAYKTKFGISPRAKETF